jgi:pyruvate/2-oxoglutarate dehydrogenase complex dihydrolipoamide acyltransferase (E2) component
MPAYKTHRFPKTRIATLDVCTIGLQKHHISALLEMDITGIREKIKQYRKKQKAKISFTAWLIKVISDTIKENELAGAWLKGKRKVIIFSDINVSVVVEKNLNGQKVPIPLIIEKANERSIESITRQINDARDKEFTDKDIVLHSRAGRWERLYYSLPRSIRLFFWQYLLRHPQVAFNKMGNVSITSVGMMGRANGWFIPIAVHPVCFGISNLLKKPVVINNKIEIREILNMTVLLDHDVIDGAPMTRFISELTGNIESGKGL